MKNSPIEWTGDTDNIIVVEGGGWWCRKISPGCGNCYAARLNTNTFYGGNNLPYSGPVPTLKLRRDLIDGWQRQTRPRRHFVASMTDVFGEWVEREWIFYFLDGMLAAPLQTFQVLTKRPAVAAREISAWLEARDRFELPANIWIGTSVEDQQRADERIPYLLGIPAAVHFLSCEPLLGPVDLTALGHGDQRGLNSLTGEFRYYRDDDGEPCSDWGPSIAWVIVGGESGPKARPMHPEWARSLRDQSLTAAVPVPFFFKQWGEAIPGETLTGGESAIAGTCCLHRDGHIDTADCVSFSYEDTTPDDGAVRMHRVGKKAAGRLLDGQEHNQFPQLVTA